ncbi:MAG: lamin tail domain-containing protein, partial [Ignavibacteria bacterium]
MLLRGINLFFYSLFIISGLVAQNDSTITFSEVMFYPESGPNEFIEIYNYSTSEAIDLDGFEIVYYTANPDVITDAGEGTLLQPQSFALILEGDYPIGSGIYDSFIPVDALILRITDNAFGSSGMANTSDRPLWLISASGDTLEVYTYSANNSRSITDEKIELVNDNSSANWGNSEIVNGTPGFRNSISPITSDLEISALSLSPEIPVVNEDVSIYALIKNRGLSNASFYSIGIYNDADFDSTAGQGELIFTENYFDLQPGDSILANTVISFDNEGDYQIIAVVNFNEDENLINNEMIISFTVYPEGINFN